MQNMEVPSDRRTNRKTAAEWYVLKRIWREDMDQIAQSRPHKGIRAIWSSCVTIMQADVPIICLRHDERCHKIERELEGVAR